MMVLNLESSCNSDFLFLVGRGNAAIFNHVATDTLMHVAVNLDFDRSISSSYKQRTYVDPTSNTPWSDY